MDVDSGEAVWKPSSSGSFIKSLVSLIYLPKIFFLPECVSSEHW